MDWDRPYSGNENFYRPRSEDDYGPRRQYCDDIARSESRNAYQRGYNSYRPASERPYVDTSGRRYHRLDPYTLVADESPVVSPVTMDSRPAHDRGNALYDPRLSQTRISSPTTTQRSASVKPAALSNEVSDHRSPPSRKSTDFFDEKRSPSRSKDIPQSPADSDPRRLNLEVSEKEQKQHQATKKSEAGKLSKNHSTSDFGVEFDQDIQMGNSSEAKLEEEGPPKLSEGADLIRDKMREWGLHTSTLANLRLELDKTKKGLSRLKADEEAHAHFPSHKERDTERRHREEKREGQLTDKIQHHEAQESSILSQIVAEVFLATNPRTSKTQSELDTLRSEMLELKNEYREQNVHIRRLEEELATSRKELKETSSTLKNQAQRISILDSSKSSKHEIQNLTGSLPSVQEALRKLETSSKVLSVEQQELRSQVEHSKSMSEVEKLSEKLESLRDDSVRPATYKGQIDKIDSSIKNIQNDFSELRNQHSKQNTIIDSLDMRLSETKGVAEASLPADSNVISLIHKRLGSVESSMKEMADVPQKHDEVSPKVMDNNSLEKSEAFVALRDQVQDIIKGNNSVDNIVIQHVDERLELVKETTDRLNKRQEDMSSGMSTLAAKQQALEDFVESRIPAASSPRIAQVPQRTTSTPRVVSVPDGSSHQPQKDVQPSPTATGGRFQRPATNYPVFSHPQQVQGMQQINPQAQAIHYQGLAQTQYGSPVQPVPLQHFPPNVISQHQQQAAHAQFQNQLGGQAQSPAPNYIHTMRQFGARISALEDMQKAYEHGMRSATLRLDQLNPDQIIHNAVCATLQHPKIAEKIGPIEKAYVAIATKMQMLTDKQNTLEQNVQGITDGFAGQNERIDNVEKTLQDFAPTVAGTREQLHNKCATQIAEIAENYRTLDMKYQALTEEKQSPKNASSSESVTRSTPANPAGRSPRTPISNTNENGRNPSPDGSEPENPAADLLKQFQASSPARPSAKPLSEKMLTDKTNRNSASRANSKKRLMRQITDSGDESSYSSDEPSMDRLMRQAPVKALTSSTPITTIPTSTPIKPENSAPKAIRTLLTKRKKTTPITISSGSELENEDGSSSTARKKTKTPTPLTK